MRNGQEAGVSELHQVLYFPINIVACTEIGIVLWYFSVLTA